MYRGLYTASPTHFKRKCGLCNAGTIEGFVIDVVVRVCRKETDLGTT